MPATRAAATAGRRSTPSPTTSAPSRTGEVLLTSCRAGDGLAAAVLPALRLREDGHRHVGGGRGPPPPRPDPTTEQGALTWPRPWIHRARAAPAPSSASSTEKIAWLTTVDPDGQPQASPIWFLWDDGEVLLFSDRPRAAQRQPGRPPARRVQPADQCRRRGCRDDGGRGAHRPRRAAVLGQHGLPGQVRRVDRRLRLDDGVVRRALPVRDPRHARRAGGSPTDGSDQRRDERRRAGGAVGLDGHGSRPAGRSRRRWPRRWRPDRTSRSPSGDRPRSGPGGGPRGGSARSGRASGKYRNGRRAAASSMVVVRPPWTTARSLAARCRYRSGTKARTSTPGRGAQRRPDRSAARRRRSCAARARPAARPG